MGAAAAAGLAYLKTLAEGKPAPRLVGKGWVLEATTHRRSDGVHRWACTLTDQETERLHNGADVTTVRPEYYRGQTPLNQLLMLEMG